jgi:carbon storage regulator
VLVLTRRASQSIMIGHDVVVTVLEVRGDQIRLGIRAPRDIDVHREEVFRQLQQANRLAASPNLEALEKLGSIIPPEEQRAPGNDPARRE